MFRRACFALVLGTLTPQVALADCWGGQSAHAFQFLWSATVEDVEHCLHRGIGPNVRDSEGVPPLFSMSVIGTNNPDGLAVISALVRAGGDAHYAPRGWKKFVTALYRAEEEWGKDSDVVRAMRGEAPRAPSGSAWERTAVVYGWTGGKPHRQAVALRNPRAARRPRLRVGPGHVELQSGREIGMRHDGIVRRPLLLDRSRRRQHDRRGHGDQRARYRYGRYPCGSRSGCARRLPIEEERGMQDLEYRFAQVLRLT